MRIAWGTQPEITCAQFFVIAGCNAAKMEAKPMRMETNDTHVQMEASVDLFIRLISFPVIMPNSVIDETG